RDAEAEVSDALGHRLYGSVIVPGVVRVWVDFRNITIRNLLFFHRYSLLCICNSREQCGIFTFFPPTKKPSEANRTAHLAVIKILRLQFYHIQIDLSMTGF